jgi:autotransporter-associated beta strand protein
MKTTQVRRRTFPFAARMLAGSIAALTLPPAALRAQTVYHDPAATTWNASATNWGNALGGPYSSTWTDANVANFAQSAARTVTLGASFNPSATGIVLDASATGNLIIDKDAGGNTITVGASGIANNSATSSLQINPNVTLGTSQTWSMAANSVATALRVDGNLALGTNNLQIDNGGETFALNGALTGSGSLNVNVTATGGNGTLAGDLSGWTGNLTLDGANTAHTSQLTVSSAFNSATTVTVKGQRTINVTATNLAFTNPFNISDTGVFNGFGAIRKETAGTLDLGGLITVQRAGLQNGISANNVASVVNINGGVQSSSAGAYFQPQGSGTFNINSAMSNGTGTLTFRVQSSAVTVNMNTNHSFTGTFEIIAGTVRVTELKNKSVNSQTGNNTAFTFNNNFANGAGTLRIDGTTSTDRDLSFQRINLGTNPNAKVVLDVTGTNVATFSGQLQQVAGANTPLPLEKAGTGTLVLSNSTNTYAGATTISAGTLQIGNGGTTGSLPAITAITNNGNLTINRSNAFTQATDLGAGVAITGTGSFTQAGTGTTTLTAANTYSGATTISAGTLQIGNGSTTGRLTATSAITNNGNLTINRSDAFSQATDLGTGVAITGTGSFTQAGAGTTTLTATNTYTGATTISAGTLQAGATAGGQAFGNLSAVTLANVSGATLALNNFNQTIGSLAGGGATGGNVTLGSATLTTGGDNTSTSYGGVINGTGGSLTKTGSGTQTLTGTNTYTGTTIVTSGSLQVGNAGTGTTGTGAVTVQNGATMLGTGTVQGSNVVILNGAMVYAGDGTAQSNYGTLNFAPASGSGSFDFQSGSSTILGINPGGVGDLLNFNGLSAGTLNFNGNLAITAPGYVPSSVDIFNVLDWANFSTTTFASRYSAGSYSGLLLGNGDDNLGFDLPDISGSGYAWDISQFTTNGTIMTTLLVPEPSRALLLLLGLTGFVTRRRGRSGCFRAGRPLPGNYHPK